MCVTDIVRVNHEYIDGEWVDGEGNLEKDIKHYNETRNRFLSYVWGVWITAYARANLWSGILECKDDYIYSDTDSIKCLNYEKHKPYFEQYNKQIVEDVVKCMVGAGIDPELAFPKTIKGVVKPIGVWDWEGHLDKFKSLGAKRYMLEKDGEIELTVAGVNKKTALPYMLEKYGKDGVWDAFQDEMEIPPEASGKMTHTYNDNEIGGYVTDYLGNTAGYYERSFVHLENSKYEMGIAAEYMDFLMKVREEEGL